ncbi:hypothetical protein AX15_007404 [Amanita polypyramis BW_CC]|nr:hypothetical protein AX15_007404 [Amanita polypyramis BW_CC]
MAMYDDEEIAPGDIVAVRHGTKGRQEGLVVSSYYDNKNRQIIEVQLESEVYHAWYPSVTLVRRTVRSAAGINSPFRKRTVERRIYW